MMNLEDFRRLVATMRAFQKAYFQHRLPGDLAKSKEFERRVDAELRSEREPGLFDSTDGAGALR